MDAKKADRRRTLDLHRVVKAAFPGMMILGTLAFIAGILFSLIEGKSIGDSIYWAVITMTTVGYGDYTPQHTMGKVVSILLACFGITLYGYLGAVILAVVMESSLSGVFGLNKCKYHDHFIICGWTPISEVVLAELIAAESNIAVITEKQDDVPIIKRMQEKAKVFPIYGDPSKTEVLDQAKVRRARVIILSMDDDSKNLITALHIKELNPNARIIVKTSRPELKKTMRIAGVTYVVTPHEMAGRLIASAAFEPEVANFVEDVTTATDLKGYDLQQYTITQEHAGLAGEISKKMKQKTNTTLVAVGKRTIKKGTNDERWDVHPNPEDNMRVHSGDVIILLGNDSQFKKVQDYLGLHQGR